MQLTLLLKKHDLFNQSPSIIHSETQLSQNFPMLLSGESAFGVFLTNVVLQLFVQATKTVPCLSFEMIQICFSRCDLLYNVCPLQQTTVCVLFNISKVACVETVGKKRDAQLKAHSFKSA